MLANIFVGLDRKTIVHFSSQDLRCPVTDVPEVAWSFLVATDYSIFREIFSFMLTYVTRCALCDMTTEHTDPCLNILAVPIPGEKENLNLLVSNAI